MNTYAYRVAWPYVSIFLVLLSGCDPLEQRRLEAKRIHDLRLRVASGDIYASGDLLEILRSGDDFSRMYVMREIAELKDQGDFAFVALLQILNDDSGGDAMEAARCLARVAPSDDRVVKAIMKKMELHETIAHAMATSLGEMGAPAAEAIPSLEMAVRTNGSLLQSAARDAILRIREAQQKLNAGPK